MINGYSFYHKGEHFATCSNKTAENLISTCADLARKGLTPFWCEPLPGWISLAYSDSFKLEKLSCNTATIITPDNIELLPKSIRKELAKFEYDGEEWKAKEA